MKPLSVQFINNFSVAEEALSLYGTISNIGFPILYQTNFLKPTVDEANHPPSTLCSKSLASE